MKYGNQNTIVSQIFSFIIYKNSRIASIKLHSKSYRQIYMEWMHEKSLRNKKLLESQRHYIRKLACRRSSPPSYPLRPATKQQFPSIGGFNQHPNSSQEM
jgi:hypothetical protein